MKTETYHCDKCKKKTEKGDLQIIYVGMGVHSYHSRNVVQFDLCAKCSAKVGIIKQVIKNDEIVNEPQELKEKLFDVMADLVHEIHREVEHDH